MEEELKEMSLPEKKILCELMPESDGLGYPLKPMPIEQDGYNPENEYEIPLDDKPRVLEKLYPFTNTPKMDENLFDLHEGKKFTVRDFRVIRYKNRDMLVSPYYPHSGGMVVDWIENPEGGSFTREIKVRQSE